MTGKGDLQLFLWLELFGCVLMPFVMQLYSDLLMSKARIPYLMCFLMDPKETDMYTQDLICTQPRALWCSG